MFSSDQGLRQKASVSYLVWSQGSAAPPNLSVKCVYLIEAPGTKEHVLL